MPKNSGGVGFGAKNRFRPPHPQKQKEKVNEMGANKIEQQKGRADRKIVRREGRDNAASLNRIERRRNRGNGEAANWGVVDPVALVRAIQAVSVAGGAIRLGFNRAGDTFAIGIYDGEESVTEYVRPTEDPNFYFTGLAEDYEQ